MCPLLGHDQTKIPGADRVKYIIYVYVSIHIYVYVCMYNSRTYICIIYIHTPIYTPIIQEQRSRSRLAHNVHWLSIN